MVRENIIEFRGTKNGILIYIKPKYDFEVIKQQLTSKIDKTRYFFKGAKIFDIHCDTLTTEQKEELEELMVARYEICILNQGKKNDPDKPKMETMFTGIIEGKTKFVQGTMRSGQNIDYAGNIVILGDVNPGAQITAYGNIIVMGNLRGVAHAGSNGNRDACVAAFYLDPTQLRISDIIARAPDGHYEKPKVPELARVKNNMVYIEPYLNKK
ncbi:MAG TPA: septum site-determining protein MinC [Clostridia bacterium]|nr:septum site-determining protein MinC [Clostridia bacterium]